MKDFLIVVFLVGVVALIGWIFQGASKTIAGETADTKDRMAQSKYYF